MATDMSKYQFNHTMLRVKDPTATIKFYEFLGMKQMNKMDFPDNKFSLYFLAYDNAKSTSPGSHWTDRQGILELTHNHGTENDPNFKVANGNSEPGKGFGHVCVSVDNIQAACKRLEDAGYKFQKRLTDGRMKHIAFALDPDSYWVEIIGQNPADQTEGVKETDVSTYRFNHTMIRVKDKDASLKFYQETLGMTLVRTSDNPSAEFTLYFLGYPDASSPSDPSTSNQAFREGLLELTYNYGTEKDANFKYHDGNAEPQGFGHICISVDDLDKACGRFEAEGVRWKKRLTDGRMKNVAFILDPDGYWIEVIQNEKIKQRWNI
ncbi:MAG: Lactoylglutathione lyase [Icmadophila ericetorum]|nr:Lactoylglutathione lyase [Icmadophila ericetorum]